MSASVVQYPSISNIQSNIDKASSFFLQQNVDDAKRCISLASSELTMLQKDMQIASTSLENLASKAEELYGKKMAPASEATTAKAIFRLRVFYQTEPGDTIELRGEKKAGLSWKQGKALTCYGDKKWKLDLETQGSFEYKLMLHKADGAFYWERGEKNRMYCNAPVDSVPKFPIFKPSDPGFILVDDKE